MKGSETKLVSYMQGSDKRFIIPVYQRNYDWKQENCKQLFDDLVKIISKDRKSHFFGSIVSVHHDGEFNEFQVIDGQQRLTTISLLFLAMYNLMKDGVIVPAQSNLANKIYKTYLIDEWQEDETRIKLKPVKNDQKAFSMLFKDEEDFIVQSNLTINYNFFCDQIKKERLSIDELYTAITRLEIINITLNQDDNPQLIFESLNSTGLALSEGDKIRNFILMGLPTKEQNVYYEKYWNKIELATEYDVSSFIRDYLSVKQQSIPAMSKVYITFKAYVEDSEIEIEALLEDMLAYAKRYSVLLKGKTADKKLNACIYRLNRLTTTVTRPFFMEVLRMQEEGVISLAEVTEIFVYTENYLFRRSICDLATNSLNKIFLMLHKEIIRYDGTSNDYLEKFKYALLSKNDRGKFPEDEEFAEALSRRQVYQMNSKNKLYIFERIENGGTLEDKDIYGHCDNGTYTIEHIMPQHLTPAWAEALGPEYKEIHEQWLHRLANLTLTAYNSKYSNNSFEDKRDRKDGFRESGLRMNTWIAQQPKWTRDELEARNDMLVGKALEIWALPKTTFVPAEKQLDCYTLEDDVDLSGREISRFEYKNTVQPVSSWIDMMEQILKILHEEDKSVLSQLAHTHDPSNELDVYVSDNPANLRAALLIDDGIYVERNTCTNAKINILKKFFKAFNAEPDDLVFYLKDVSQGKTADETGSRQELRRRYWNMALPYIKQLHGENAAFSNTNPSKDNWINGFIGIRGFNISCVANYDEARVEMVLSTSSKELNKAAFDYVFARKNDIEDKLGIFLEWRRSNDTKASYIIHRLPEIGIINEMNWIQMAKFHAEWSKKFYDVIVPVLQEWNNTERKYNE